MRKLNTFFIELLICNIYKEASGVWRLLFFSNENLSLMKLSFSVSYLELRSARKKSNSLQRLSTFFA